MISVSPVLKVNEMYNNARRMMTTWTFSLFSSYQKIIIQSLNIYNAQNILINRYITWYAWVVE